MLRERILSRRLWWNNCPHDGPVMKERGVLHSLPQQHIPNDLRALVSPAPKAFYRFQESQCEVNTDTWAFEEHPNCRDNPERTSYVWGGRGLSPTNPLVCPTWVSFHPARVFTHGTTKALVMNCDFSHSSPQAIHQGKKTSYRPLDLTPWPPPQRKEPWGKGPRAGEMLGLLGKMKQCLFFQAHKRLTHGCLTIPPGVMTQAQVLETRV